jgi:uncharacterized protein
VIKLDISSLPEGHSHQDIEASADGLDLALDGGCPSSPVTVSLDITRSGDEIYITGRARVDVLLQCGRCLEQYSSTLESPVEVMAALGDRVAGDQDDSLIRLPAGAKCLDLTDVVRSELLVRLPLKPLCRDDCRGLCPKCGTNLNVDACSCREEKSDSRWDALKHLKGEGQ